MIVLHQQHEEAVLTERRRAPSMGIGAADAVAADDEVPLLAPRLPPPTPPAAAVPEPTEPTEPTPQQRARRPDDVDDVDAQ